MRLYVCVSESVKLSDLASLLESLKVSNEVNGIRGVFSYNHGHYLQIIEGEDQDVTNLIRDIQKDSRHQNIVEILDVDTEDRYFSDWSMNLVPLLKRNASFIEFTNFLTAKIELLSRKQKRLFNIFHDLSSIQGQSRSKDFLVSSLVYSIEEWPDFDVIPPSSCLMSLCGTLMRNPTSFRTLVRKKYCGAEVELRSMLNKLNRAGYLLVSQNTNTNPVSKQQIILEQNNENRFQKWHNSTQPNPVRAAAAR